MGGSVSKAANDIGSFLGDAFAAPFKALFGRSCKGFALCMLLLKCFSYICSGTWDVFCFIEHICIRDLVRLLLVCGLCYIGLIFLYLLYKVGICQCCIKSFCKMWCAACDTYWFILEQACCLCWRKLTNTERVYRGHRRRQRRRQRLGDLELGYSTWSDDSVVDRTRRSSLVRKRDHFRERRKGGRRRRRSSMNHASWGSFHSFRRPSCAGDRIGKLSCRSHELRSPRKHRGKMSVRIGSSCRSRGRGNKKQLRIRRLNNRRRRKATSHKRRRI